MVSVGLFKIDLDIDQESINAPYIIDTITEQLEGFILEEVEADAEDGLFNIVEEISIRLQENYEELIGEDTDKRHFIKSLTRVFALLLNTKVDTVDKIKKVLRIAVETTLKIWQGNIFQKQALFRCG